MEELKFCVSIPLLSGFLFRIKTLVKLYGQPQDVF